MLSGCTSNALLTKARAQYGQMLSENDYSELLKKSSVADVCGYLKSQTAYGDTLAPYSEAAIHRGQLEGLLDRDIFELYIRLCRFETVCTGGSEKFYGFLKRRLEIQQILYCIRLLNAKTKDVYIKNLPSYFTKYADFDLIELAKVMTMEELLEVIAKTPYAKILSVVSADGDGRVDYIRCEQLLYSYYYKMIIESAERNFEKDTARELCETVRRIIRTKNIITVYRLKNYFNEDTGSIINRLILADGKSDRRFYERLCESDGKKEFFDILNKASGYRKYGLSENGNLERDLDKAMAADFKKQIRLSSKAPVVFYALTALLEIETRNITTIIEGIRYNTPPKEIEDLLV